MNAENIKDQLDRHSNAEKKNFLSYFFKTEQGQYGEGDKFLGVVVPDIRKVSKANKDTELPEIEQLLNSEYHECRMCALLILVERFKKAKKEDRKQIYDFYLSHTARINNWDLVDLSSKDIIGEYLLDKKDRSILYQLAGSTLLWDQRIAIISTFAFIKKNDFTDTIRLSEIYLGHKHDLIHKATGWMLREVGKRDRDVLIAFLDAHAPQMPRTMLRYSIEKLEPQERLFYLNKKI